MSKARRVTFFAGFGLAFVLTAVACGPSRPTGRGNPLGGCPAGCTQCNADGNCIDCPTPGGHICSGTAVVECNADGTVGPTVKMCDAGYSCVSGDCLSACDVAAASRSYIGCDYWPTTTLTSELNPYFDFAVAVANPLKQGDVTQGLSAEVTITRDGSTIATKSVAPGTVETIILPWVQELTFQPNCKKTGECTPAVEKSAKVSGGAYHLVSSIPVTVYQFSPLQFEKPLSATCFDEAYDFCARNADCKPGDICQVDPGSGLKSCFDKNCHSYTNDATILLPTTALRTDYLAVSRETFTVTRPGGSARPLPGFVTIVATENDTNLMVTSTAFTEAGADVTALSPGGSQSFLLQKGEVLQLVSKRGTTPCAASSTDSQATRYCDLGAQYDLTGSHITADKRIAVFGGHSCSFVPYNRFACDHLEEQLTPIDTWGQKILVAQTRPATKSEPNIFRVISGSDDNTVTFDPASVHKQVTMRSGEFFEFTTTGGFAVSSSGRIAVAQFMVGENFFDTATIDVGDPSLGLGIPVEQYRADYDFLSPSTYTKNDLTLIAPMNSTIKLDDADVPNEWTPIGGSGFGYQYVALNPGAHHVSGSSAFGITVSGIANFTSYLFVGGQNLNDVPLQ